MDFFSLHAPQTSEAKPSALFILYPGEQRGQFEGSKQIFFVCTSMMIGRGSRQEDMSTCPPGSLLQGN